jgi:ParB/RepB/Spo0J family partition protein
MNTIAVAAPEHVHIDLIDVDDANVRELDEAHVDALAGSIELRGLINPVTLRPNGERFTLVAGYHRLAACRKLGITEIPASSREQDATSADTAAENILRKDLSPLAEARAVAYMFSEGYTPDGAASALGWSRALVSSRAKILELPEIAQRLLDSGELPVSSVEILLYIAGISRELCEAALAAVGEGQITGSQFVRDPAWAIGYALRNTTKTFGAYLSTTHAREIAELRLGKKATATYAEAEALNKALDRYAHGAPTIRFGEVEVDQARAAGVLIEFEHGNPVITDRALYRELVKQAIARTRDELQTAKDAADADRGSRHSKGQAERTPQQKLEAEHRASVREFTRRAHATNLDLGSALLTQLATVDPGDMDVARFFAYGVLGPDTANYLGSNDHRALMIAANGIRLVFDEHRSTLTPRLKNGGWGKTKVTYGEPADAAKWLWKFVEGARTPGELYGRVLVVFAAQHYAQDLVIARSKRRPSTLPASRKGTALKAFERIVKDVLPASHKDLQRAIAAEAKAYTKRQVELLTAESSASASHTAAEDLEDSEDAGVDEDELLAA